MSRNQKNIETAATLPALTEPAKSPDGLKQPQSHGFITDPSTFETYARKAKELGLPALAKKNEDMARQLKKFRPKAGNSSPEPARARSRSRHGSIIPIIPTNSG